MNYIRMKYKITRELYKEIKVKVKIHTRAVTEAM